MERQCRQWVEGGHSLVTVGEVHAHSVSCASRLNLSLPTSTLRMHEVCARAELPALSIMQSGDAGQFRPQHGIEIGPSGYDIGSVLMVGQPNRTLAIHDVTAAG